MTKGDCGPPTDFQISLLSFFIKLNICAFFCLKIRLGLTKIRLNPSLAPKMRNRSSIPICRIGLPFLKMKMKMKVTWMNLMRLLQIGPSWRQCVLLIQCILPKSFLR
jgi:hypothetical protein